MMFRKLLGKLLGDFPPKGLNLCDQCRTAYTSAGIFTPPLNYDQLVDILYNFALLCPKPCGVVFPKPPQPGIGFRALQLFLRSGISCHNCRVALLTMTHIVSIITTLRPEFSPSNHLIAETYMLKGENLICDECLSAFRENYQGLMSDLEKILQEERQR